MEIKAGACVTVISEVEAEVPESRTVKTHEGLRDSVFVGPTGSYAIMGRIQLGDLVRRKGNGPGTYR